MKLCLSRACVVIILLLSLRAWAQLPDTLWTRIYPELIDSCYFLGAIGATRDNGFALAGYYCDHPTTNDGVLLKGDSTGAMQWLRAVVGPGVDMFKGVVGTSDGGVLAVGEWYDDPDGFRLLAAKYAASGDTEWIRTYDQMVGITGYRALELETGEIVIAGDFYGMPGLAKITADGDLVFMRQYVHPWHRATRDYRVTETADHGFIIVSSIEDNIYPPPHRLFLYIIRTDGQGDTVWTRTLGFWERDHDIWPHGICRADSDTYLIAADVDDPGPDWMTHLTLLKLTDQGDTLWSRRYEFPGYEQFGEDPPYPVRLVADPRGGFLVSSTFMAYSSGGLVPILFKVDQDGNVLWVGEFFDPRWECKLYDLTIAEDGTYLWLLGYGIGWAEVVRLEADSSNAAPQPLRPMPKCHLAQNYPNPFNSTTEISFSLLRTEQATLKVYDVLGREVQTLVDGRMIAGDHRVIFDGAGLPSGVYLCRLETGELTQTRKMVLIK